MRSTRRIWIAIVIACGLVLGACGDDDDSGSDDNGSVGDDSASDDAADNADDTFVPVDSDLLLPSDYLQGVWCDNEGATWTIDGDTAVLDDGAGGTGTFPLGVLFVDAPGNVVVTQADDAFTVDLGDDEITFTRGAC